MACGISDALYWSLTREELVAVLKVHAARERSANLRAGLVAATICNTNPYRKKGARRIQPGDFFRSAKREHMSVAEAQKFMNGWASTINKDAAAQGGK
ncbi:hypothetical protein LCGC14_0691710 [marine sediment metagenome]|uniref:Uncharacterized protein n=1 Tax=marine sediment metagenome TaxID=412755 RepID=A0A0F9R5K4_9ZZZZ